MKIAFLTLGCKLNYAETSTYERGFKEAGLEVVPWQQKADIYLVNTCSVTATSDSKSRNLIRKVHRVNPSARIVVTGCSAQLRREEIERISGVTRVFGAEEKSLVVSETLHGGAVPGTDIPRVFGAYSTGERTRSFLKVQDGCNNFCKYCTVPYARGRSRNIPISECVENAQKIASEGIKEIVLTGVNTGDFGRTTGESFLDLLKALNDVDGIERYRISSIEPNLITEEIVDWIASGTKFQPHFHIPLQSGSDTVLRLMHRHYDTALFRTKVERIRQVMPDAFIGVDVIVGTRGETAECFEETYTFLESLDISQLHVFSYSERPGTKALEIPHVVSPQEKHARSQRLIALSERKHRAFCQRFVGTVRPVLWEHAREGQPMQGFTDNYVRVEMPADHQALDNTITSITLTDFIP